MRILRMGSLGPAAALLQLALNRAGAGELDTDGVFGARLSGGGFGGSIVVLVEKAKAEAAGRAIAAAYAARTGKTCDVRAIRASEGARLV